MALKLPSLSLARRLVVALIIIPAGLVAIGGVIFLSLIDKDMCREADAQLQRFGDATADHLVRMSIIDSLMPAFGASNMVANSATYPIASFREDGQPHIIRNITEVDARSAFRQCKLGTIVDGDLPTIGACRIYRPSIAPDSITLERIPPRIRINSERMPDANRIAVLYVMSLKPLNERRWHIMSSYVILFLLLIVLLSVIGWFVGRSVLNPLLALRNAVSTIDVTKLDQRIDVGLHIAELSPITDALNTALQRVADAFAREQRINANIAHEVRTPLTVIINELEHIQRQSPHLAATALDACHHLHRMIDTITALSRLESGTTPLQVQALDISDIINDVIALTAPTAQRRHIYCDNTIPLTSEWQHDPTIIRLIARNIIANAVCYADERTNVTISATNRRDVMTLIVSNTCTTLKEQDIDHIFEPYWRNDKVRSGSEHLGLGLALIHRMIMACGGTITAGISGKVVTMTVTLPIIN